MDKENAFSNKDKLKADPFESKEKPFVAQQMLT